MKPIPSRQTCSPLLAPVPQHRAIRSGDGALSACSEQAPRKRFLCGCPLLLIMFCYCLLGGVGTGARISSVQAEDFHNGFEEAEVSVRPLFEPHRVVLKTHERNTSLGYSGQAAERLQFVTAEFNVPIQMECPVPPARILDELSLSVAVFSNRPGTQLSLRVVFPHQKNPETGKPLTRLIHGETLEKANSWQRLTCRTSDEILSRHLILWRGALKPQELETRGMYVDCVVLSQTLGKGMTEILLDDLRAGPIVAPDPADLVAQEVIQPAVYRPDVQFQLDQLQVDGRPIFPIVVPYQREPVELFRQLGANVVWIDNYQNTELISQFNAQRIWATAWPPSAKSEQGEILNAQQANLVPFGPETDGILFWNLGVRIEPTTHKQLKHWVQQVRVSDRQQNRPILADVTGEELIFSRDADMLGISKHIVQSPYSFYDYSAHLRNRMLLAQPGTFIMTWLQTEPSRAVTQFRATSGLSPAIVEPEQIRLQTYLALCAGCKGLGYWNWTPLNAEGPGFDERRLVLEQLMQEMRLLEPFLASGEVIHRFEIPFQSTLADKMVSTEPASVQAQGKPSRGLSATAAVVRSEHGLIILLAGQEENAQYVPGPMGQHDVKIMVRGLPESAFLWEITPTGIWPLETKRVTGGTEVRLPRFNLTAALMVATDQEVAQKMEQEIQKLQVRSAELSLQLAEAKFARVLAVDQQLMEQGVGLTEGTQVLEQARRTIDTAREAFTKQQYHQARTNADMACQLLRIIQRMYWHQAVRHVSSPTSIPHTLCFQTLPDYWKLIQQLGQAETAQTTVLRSGQFEDPDAMRVEGWTKDISPSKQIIVYDALDPNTAHQGEYCLRMAAVPAEGTLFGDLQEPSVCYRSPRIPVKPGDLLHVTGWVRIPRPITNSLEGFRIYDSQYGIASCLHWSQKTEWQQFELMRPIWKQDDVQIHLELNGLGDVAVDDLQVKIVRLQPEEILQQTNLTSEDDAQQNPKTKANALDFLNRFIK